MFTANTRARGRGGIDFDVHYVVTWGQDHILKLNQGKEVQLSMDQSSGSLFLYILLSKYDVTRLI